MRPKGILTLNILHHVCALFAIIAAFNNSTSAQAIWGIAAFAFMSVVVRRGWAALDADPQSPRPSLAQGLLFVPLFNFYWIFRALPGLAKSHNKQVEAAGRPQDSINGAFGLVAAILFCVHAAVSEIASLHSLSVLIYLCYVGFTVTFLWQIHSFTKALDTQSAPAIVEPNKMATIAVAGIVFGSALFSFVAIEATKSLATPSPDRIAESLHNRGYPTKVVDRNIEVQGLGRITVKELRVYNRGTTPGLFSAPDRIGGIFYVSSSYDTNQSTLIGNALGSTPQRTSDVIYFKPYKEGSADSTSVIVWLGLFN